MKPIENIELKGDVRICGLHLTLSRNAIKEARKWRQNQGEVGLYADVRIDLDGRRVFMTIDEFASKLGLD